MMAPMLRTVADPRKPDTAPRAPIEWTRRESNPGPFD